MNPLNHVAIIMDGNGRWGLKKYNSRKAGHKAVSPASKGLDIAVSLFSQPGAGFSSLLAQRRLGFINSQRIRKGRASRHNIVSSSSQMGVCKRAYIAACSQ